ncbi:MAG: PIN domain-containing protein [Methylococcales bacterium]|nr:PIN domain-containing protein [Methylococcales bacterium]
MDSSSGPATMTALAAISMYRNRGIERIQRIWAFRPGRVTNEYRCQLVARHYRGKTSVQHSDIAQQEIFFLWRPLLRDPKDDHVAELAVAAGCDAIVTYNLKDFTSLEQFGLRVITPLELLDELGEI